LEAEMFLIATVFISTEKKYSSVSYNPMHTSCNLSCRGQQSCEIDFPSGSLE